MPWLILVIIHKASFIQLNYLNQVEKEKELGLREHANLPRQKWDAYDPNLIAEALFAAANIFSCLKLIYIFTVNPHLGPLQISLGRMIMDLMKFAVLYVLLLFSFACGLNHLHWYYAALRREECDKNRLGSYSAKANDAKFDPCDRRFKSFAK